MEGNNQFESVDAVEQETQPFLRVEFDGEHKIFVKECAECGKEFSTSVPRKFFRNPNNESIKLHTTGAGAIDGYENIKASEVTKNILNMICPDDSRHNATEPPL